MQGHSTPSPPADKLHSEAPAWSSPIREQTQGGQSDRRARWETSLGERARGSARNDASAWGRLRPGARGGRPPPGGRSEPQAQPGCRGGGAACWHCHRLPTWAVSGVLPPRTLQKASFSFKKGVKQRKAKRQWKGKDVVFAVFENCTCFLLRDKCQGWILLASPGSYVSTLPSNPCPRGLHFPAWCLVKRRWAARIFTPHLMGL